jgi:hypothetical protein
MQASKAIAMQPSRAQRSTDFQATTRLLFMIDCLLGNESAEANPHGLGLSALPHPMLRIAKSKSQHPSHEKTTSLHRTPEHRLKHTSRVTNVVQGRLLC